MIDEGPKDVMVLPGNDTVDFQCVASTDRSTLLALSWRKDNVNVNTSDPRINIAEDGTLLTLNFFNLPNADIEKRYAGVYKCIASNSYTSQEKSAKLTVKFPGISDTGMVSQGH